MEAIPSANDDGELLDTVRQSVEAIGAALTACRSTLREVEVQMGRLERQLAALEAAQPHQPVVGDDPGRMVPAATGTGQEDLVERVERLRAASEAMLKRPLKAYERPLLLRWAQLERGGQPVPVEEILQVVARLLSRRTREGTLPSSLAWCDATVETLSRGAMGPTPPRGADVAAEYAAMYEAMADRLDAEAAP
ncbi:MAG TPA: hypothetical protein VIA06_18895 [Candidatus Dormibacteraeota bacterium]|jgi:hypothetical protein|nr:hypothetical protein [Candidatus Dormibacteraeota bacterium]